MTDIDPHLQGAIVRLVLALESMDRRYCLIGALVPRFLMLVPPPQRTRDVDVVVDVGSIQDVEQLTRDLRSRGYADVAPPMRFRDESGGFLHCARYHEDVEEGERRYGLEHAKELVPLEFGGAFLLGLDGLPYQDRRLRERLTPLLDRFVDGEVPDLGEAARDAGHLATDDRWREECHQLIRWYRLGARL